MITTTIICLTLLIEIKTAAESEPISETAKPTIQNMYNYTKTIHIKLLPIRADLIENLPNSTPTPKEYLKEVFGNDFENAKKVITCESGWREKVISKTGDYSLFQINLSVHYNSISGNTRQEKINNLLDWKYNIDFAKMLFNQRGWKDWYASNNCHKLLD